MLQRIQSIYLLLASAALFALFFFPLVHNVYIDGKTVSIMASGIFESINGKLVETKFFSVLTVATAIIALIPLAIIFWYKNRVQQIALCYSLILLIFGFTFWMAQTVKKVMGDTMIDTHNWGIGLFLSTISIFFIVLAQKAIKKDEKLVKSADRLR